MTEPNPDVLEKVARALAAHARFTKPDSGHVDAIWRDYVGHARVAIQAADLVPRSELDEANEEIERLQSILDVDSPNTGPGSRRSF